ncbi:MAG: TAT-variant-translocated molybdopterin oxidoreductase [Phycisphaerales bacterium]
MSKLDQCPSTKGKQPERAPDPRPKGEGSSRPWRSVEEFADTPAFREFLEREFPKGASELLGESRRDFLKLMGAGLALAGAATIPGCRRPERHIMPYSAEVPEEIIPGQALYYATSMPLAGGGAEGLLIETQAGRPTKVEGNPLHPINQGKASQWSQASVLTLYDPDRLKSPVYHNPARGRLAATWDDFRAWSTDHFKRFDSTQGRGLAFLVDKKTSPTRDAMKQRLMKRWPRAAWHVYSPAEDAGAIEGSRLAFGGAMRLHHEFEGARCVLSLDADFLCSGPASLVAARQFASTRRVRHAGDEMSRLYVLESSPTGTGSQADHRLRMAPSQITAFAVALASQILGSGSLGSVAIPGDAGIDEVVVKSIAEDLRKGPGAMVIAGHSQPPAVHALCHAINDALGALGRHVLVSPMGDDEARVSLDEIANLTDRMRAGEIDTLVCLDTNPIYDAPADLDFAAQFGAVPNTITWSVQASETAHESTWSLNGAHFLESWGDAEAWDGTLSPVQPMIAPLYAPAMSDIELLALLAGEENPEGYQLVRETWAARVGQGADTPAFDKTWRRALHDGLLAGSRTQLGGARIDRNAVSGAARSLALQGAPTLESLEIVFAAGMVGDGRWANCGWLQELPDPASKVVWDNPAYVSPKTAEALELLPEHAWQDKYDPYTKQQLPKARMATVSYDGRELVMPIWILPGMPDNTIALRLGYGRTVSGHVGDQVGFNTYALRSSGRGETGARASVRAAGKTYTISSTQDHWTMSGRDTVLRSIDKKWWDKYGDEPPEVLPDEIYGPEHGVSTIHLAERLGELNHTPPNVSIYENPLNQSRTDAAPGSTYSKGPQWGMTIDMSTCTGCGVCTIACQSENNIPIVGKTETAKGREMHWIRVDRYFAGDDLNDPSSMQMQPVACVHCENAPCETVCPVNATVHGNEGTNDMAYNRCIGTRYCANNCPYKVRRFNFFEWGWNKYNGRFYGEELISDAPIQQKDLNKNFIPPRLREKLEEIERMQLNPDVTVRSRGVMEKCTYCIQRINEARQEVKVRGIWDRAQSTTKDDPNYQAPIPEGFFQVACQQACPTESIVFGDVLDPKSKVTAWRNNQRSYMLLGYLDTRPRTTHLMRISNPNEALLEHLRPEDYERRIVHDPFHHAGAHEGGSESEGGGEEHGEAHGFFFDKARTLGDEGYALSLRVLGAATGVHA